MKSGANKLDQAQIKKGFDQGMSVSQISNLLRIKADVVETFKPKPKKKPKPETPEK